LEYKPTTYALQRFGPNITRNAIALEDFDAVQQFLLGKSQPLTASVEPGYVHVRYGEYHLGCGLYKSGLLRSQMPKSIRTMVGLVTAEES
jgi:NOL1/NOP2/fmu family ribosome biogenesis protein